MKSLICSPPRWRSRSRPRRSTSRKPAAKDTNPTNCPFFKEFGGYGLAHAAPKNMPHEKCNYNKNVRYGGRNRCARKLGSDTGKAEIFTNESVGNWIRRDAMRSSGWKL